MGEEPTGALTVEQEQAAERRGEPLLLSAAAGSGKTTVLVERFVRAVRVDGLAPSRILAITFTERAAGELRERVRARLLELGARDAARDTETAFVGTFHGFCARILRAHAPLAGLDPDFAILDEGLSGRLRDRAMRNALGAYLAGERQPAVDLLAAYGIDRVRSMILSVHAQLRSRGALAPSLPEATGSREREAVAVLAEIDRLLKAFGAEYELLKRRRAAVDFDDLELLACKLLQERPDVRQAWSGRFELLMVDEFQDTNPRQMALLTALERGNLFTVGDELQAIYGFRHADVRLFRERRDELGAVGGSLALTHNFRSDPAVIDLVNALFSPRFEDFSELVPSRARSDGPPAIELLLTDRAGWGEHPELARELGRGLPAAAAWRHAEARALAERIARMIREDGVPAGDVVVLLRAAGDLRVYERALALSGVRTLAAVGAFWEHQQVRDLLAYLRALANPLDEEALYGVLASPLVGLGSDVLGLLSRRARETGGLWRAVCEADQAPELGEDAIRALAAFCRTLSAEREAAPLRSLSELIDRVVRDLAYREHVLGLDGGERRLANVHKLLRLARRFEAAEGRDLRGFLDHVAHLADSAGAREADAPVDGAEPDAVRLMSIHAAKGLEFPVVCVADLGRAPNMSAPDLLVEDGRVGVRLMRLDGEKAEPALDFEELAAERAERESQEEDRILYVAMTRARERLLLSAGVEIGKWHQIGPSAGPISWLGPALAPDLPERLETEQGPLLIQVRGTRVRCLISAVASPPAAVHPAPAARSGTSAARPAGAVQAQLDALPAPAIATLSYSALSELERCGYRYYLQRVLGLPEAPGRVDIGGHGIAARERGTLIHRLLELADFTTGRQPSPADVARAAEELGMKPTPPEMQEIAALIGAALDSPPAATLAQARELRREHPFAFSPGPGEPLIIGVLDVLASTAQGSMLVVDYKSDRVRPDDDLQGLVERDYAVQRLLYALAVLRAGAEHVRVAHWFLARPGEWAQADYRAEDRDALEHELAGRLRPVMAGAGAFAVSDNPHRGLCLTCPGRSGLCSWGDEYTLRDDPRADIGPRIVPGQA